MRLLKQAVAVLGTLVVAIVIAAVVMPKTAHAIVATAVNVVNTPGNPVPTVPAQITTSFTATVNPLISVAVEVNPAMPSCPAGMMFLVTSVNAAPDFLAFDPSTLGAWAVRVSLAQKTSSGENSVALVAYGNGTQDVSAMLPAGQPYSNKVIIEDTGGTKQQFDVHISGYCGVPFVTP